MWGGACLWFLGNRKCLKQNFHYNKINKERELLQYMYIKIFVFYLPYILKKNQQNNTSHAIATKTAKHFSSWKLLRIKVTPDLHLTYSINGGNLGLVLKMKNIACILILLTKHVKYTYLYLFKFVLYSIVAFKAN